MNADERRSKTDQVTRRIVGAAYKVANSLGVGFVEKVYENALVHELRKAGLQVQQQHGIVVQYDGTVVGEFTADLLVQGEVLAELKSVVALDSVHEAQCLNYLRATGLKVCLLINFGRPKIQVKRFVRSF